MSVINFLNSFYQNVLLNFDGLIPELQFL